MPAFDRDAANTRKVIFTDDVGNLLDGQVRGTVWDVGSLTWVRQTPSVPSGATISITGTVNTVGGGGGGPADVGATTAASETDATRQKTIAAIRLLDTSLGVGSQLVAAKGDSTSGMWVNIKAGGGTGGGPGDVGASTAASETDAARQKTTAALRVLDTAQTAGSQLVAAKGDQTTGIWVNVKNATVPVSGTLTAVTAITNALPAGTNVIGHVIADTGSTTAVTGNVTVTQGTATSLKAEVVGTGTAGTPAGNILTIQGVAAMTKLLVTPDSVALPANQSVNVAQINGVTPLMGTGIMGTGSPRVTIASDNDALTVKQATGTNLHSVTDAGSVTAATLSAETTKVIGTVNVAAAQHIIIDTGSTTAVTGNVTVVQPTGTNLHTVVDSGTLTAVTAITNALPTGANVIGAVTQSGIWSPDVASGSTALGALNAVVAVALSGARGAGFHLAAGTLAGTLLPEMSFDGGATYVASQFIDPTAQTMAANFAVTNPNAITFRELVVFGGATHARVRVSAYTSGTADGVMRATTVVGNLAPTVGAVTTLNTRVMNAGIDAITATIAAASDGTKLEDAAHTTGDRGMSILGVRNDLFADMTNANLDYTTPVVDVKGRQIVREINELIATTISTANATVTLTIAAAGAGLFHYIKSVEIVNVNPTAAAIAGSAVTLSYTTTNIPGSPAWTAGNALATGAEKVVERIAYGGGIKTTAANTATTVVAPAIGAGGLVRILVTYYIGP